MVAIVNYALDGISYFMTILKVAIAESVNFRARKKYRPLKTLAPYCFGCKNQLLCSCFKLQKKHLAVRKQVKPLNLMSLHPIEKKVPAIVHEQFKIAM